jgi:hypothetical protein
MIMDQFVWDEIMAEAMLDEDRLLQIEKTMTRRTTFYI